MFLTYPILTDLQLWEVEAQMKIITALVIQMNGQKNRTEKETFE